MTRIRTCTLALFTLLASCSLPALAAPPGSAGANGDDAAPMPAWEQLDPAQREILVAPVRERWNANAAERARMFAHARRWQEMTPDQRQRAHRGMKRWSHMKPGQREEARALFEHMRTLPPEQRGALRTRWKAMTPEQRRVWVESHPSAPAAD